MEEETDDESETLEIMQEADCSDEYEETQKGFRDWFGECLKKSSLHENYSAIKDLSLKHLPDSIRHESVLCYIQLRAQLVVRIITRYTSTARPDDDRFAYLRGKTNSCTATGYAWIYNEESTECQCPNPNKKSCREDKHKVYRGILITTNRHVIFNDEEAEKTEVEFFYDDKNSTVVKGVGYCLREDLDKKDYVSMKIFFHDKSLFDKICKINEEIAQTWDIIPCELKIELEKRAIVISHPHGHFKMVSIGDLLEKEFPEGDDGRRVTKYTCITCTGSSGAPVLTGVYWTNPFVHSSGRHKKNTDKYTGVSYSY